MKYLICLFLLVSNYVYAECEVKEGWQVRIGKDIEHGFYAWTNYSYIGSSESFNAFREFKTTDIDKDAYIVRFNKEFEPYLIYRNSKGVYKFDKKAIYYYVQLRQCFK